MSTDSCCGRLAADIVVSRNPAYNQFLSIGGTGSHKLTATYNHSAAPPLGLAALLALCSALLGKSIKGGLIVVGGLNLSGSINPVHNAVSVAELAVEKGASLLLMPVSARRQ